MSGFQDLVIASIRLRTMATILIFDVVNRAATGTKNSGIEPLFFYYTLIIPEKVKAC